MPKKARSAQKIEGYKDALLTYFRIGKLDKFYLSSRDKSHSAELNFLQTAKLLESESDEKCRVGSAFYDLLRKNQVALADALRTDEETKYSPAASSDVYTKLRRRLLAFKPDQRQDFTDADDGLWQDALLALEHGSIAKKTVNRVWKLVEKSDEAKVVLDILWKSFDRDTLAVDAETEARLPAKPREVILSEYFI
ncbi:MAG: hypothetical protein IPI76_14630 [Chloracidobacterium sp.]|nr:hypothetical protein [Chloracidobacterium sp.]